MAEYCRYLILIFFVKQTTKWNQLDLKIKMELKSLSEIRLSLNFIEHAVKPIHRFLAWIGCKAQKHLVNQIKSSIFALSV